jgi:two-component system chemotaxis response regulator CheB
MRLFEAFETAPPWPTLVAQHMPSGFTRSFAERLDRRTPFRVREARDGEAPAAGEVLVAPGGSHLTLEAAGSRIVTRIAAAGPRDAYVPSVDRLFASAAKHYGARLLAVVLTGMGEDGREGAGQVRRAGGRVIAESEETAVIYGMPQQVVSAGLADRVLPLCDIPGALRAGLEASVGAPRRGWSGR